MQLFVRCQDVHSFEVGDEKVSHLKTLIEEAEGIPEEEQTLYIGGAPLDDEQSISECLQEGSTVDVTVKLLGGKVHGSLARAGKVRGQTPKVEKQEKKKKKTGRAKRRMQYNKRFVNVVVTFGRKRGPNANY
ncbi:40S ribosomal protein S30 [Trichonephila clavipes]|uniref:40S ribosomal protein S30 n=1 Tax=Trichonephila inaurata madagascariensis TaxID=2747483 RepID=A0A8X7CMF9_9ARAC|nr:40S ribosomal protein S30 [Trichonephila clavipes]GFY71105.1 40S ribosomal protein S30 [Trichonephila inaurata madagascariensis]